MNNNLRNTPIRSEREQCKGWAKVLMWTIGCPYSYFESSTRRTMAVQNLCWEGTSIVKRPQQTGGYAGLSNDLEQCLCCRTKRRTGRKCTPLKALLEQGGLCQTT